MGFCDGIIYGEPGQLLFAPGHPQRVGLMSVNILNWLFLSRIVFIFLWFRPLYLYLVKLGFVFQTDWDQLSERSDRLRPPAHRKWSNWGSPPLSLMVMMVMVMMVLLLLEMMMMVMLEMVMLMMVIGDDGGDSDGDDMRRKKETYIMSSMLEPGGSLNTGGDS